MSRLRIGLHGRHILPLQTRLRAMGYELEPSDAVDADTLKALRQFQVDRSIRVSESLELATLASLRHVPSAREPAFDRRRTAWQQTDSRVLFEDLPLRRHPQGVTWLLTLAGYRGPVLLEELHRFQRDQDLPPADLLNGGVFVVLLSTLQGPVIDKSSTRLMALTKLPAAPLPPRDYGFPSLMRGIAGMAVSLCQLRLRDLGCDPSGIDGDFGGKIDTQVRAFQKAKGLEPDETTNGRPLPRPMRRRERSSSSTGLTPGWREVRRRFQGNLCDAHNRVARSLDSGKAHLASTLHSKETSP